jgi:hypothetical protein
MKNEERKTNSERKIKSHSGFFVPLSFFRPLFLLLSLLFLITHSSCLIAHAATARLTLTPAEIDLQALPRDMLHGSLIIKNTDTRMLALHAFVYNIDPAQGKVAFVDPSSADRTTSLANWISITRALITINPGQSQSVDYEINLDPVAKPGIYHAVIVFADGLIRDDAEKTVGAMPQATVNLQVMDDVHEVLQIAKFTPDSSLFLRGLPKFSLLIQNVGNRSEVPTGEVRIVNSRGAEVAAIPVNGSGQSIGPSSTVAFPLALGKPISPGSYKAVLDLAYGPNQARIGDTVFFWYLPWYIMAFLLAMLLAIGGFIAFYIHARYMRWHYEHLRRLGVGGQNRRVLDLRKPEQRK